MKSTFLGNPPREMRYRSIRTALRIRRLHFYIAPLERRTIGNCVEPGRAGNGLNKGEWFRKLILQSLLTSLEGLCRNGLIVRVEQTNGFQGFRTRGIMEIFGKHLWCLKGNPFTVLELLNLIAQRFRPAFAEAATRRQV